MDVSKSNGTPKWMVYNGNPIKMDDLEVPLFLETPILPFIQKWNNFKFTRRSWNAWNFRLQINGRNDPSKWVDGSWGACSEWSALGSLGVLSPTWIREILHQLRVVEKMRLLEEKAPAKWHKRTLEMDGTAKRDQKGICWIESPPT